MLVSMGSSSRPSRLPAGTYQALHNIAVTVGGVLDPAALARIVAEQASALLSADAVVLYVWDETSGHLRALYTDDPRELTREQPVQPGRGVAGRAFSTRQIVRVNNYPAWEHALPAASARGLRAALAVPLVVAERGVGALVVRSYSRRRYGTRDEHVLALLAAQLAPALEAARLFSASERLAREAAERAAELAASEQRLRALVSSTFDVIAVLDQSSTVLYVSPTVEFLWGCSVQDVQGHSALERVHPDDLPRARSLLSDVLESPAMSVTTELRLRHGDGSWRDFELIVNNQLAEPAVAGLVATYHDVTERKAFESDMRYMALHDPLLDLPNRVLFMERLEQALADANRRGYSVGVLFLDLDNLKLINDSLGHKAGDQLLLAIAERLRGCLRDDDSTARLGGDEFTVLLNAIRGPQEATTVAQRILEQLQQPIDLGGHDVVPTVSIGVALSKPGSGQADDLLRNADVAMYRAKANGKARYELFDESMGTHAMERLELERDLRRALDRGEFRVYYQPLVALDDDEICGAEALVRWEHPTRGLVPPAHFIHLAEETGLIVPLGEWVLAEACRQTRAWQQLRRCRTRLSINVNLSGMQLQRRDLVESVARVLTLTDLDPRTLTLEVTESVAMEDAEWTATNLRRLRTLGVEVAMDDFGTGYSSLSYLKRFPVDAVKIDRSFVDGLGQDPDDTAIVRAVLALANALNLRVTAEGVETAEQLTQLRALGCDRAQGYYFAAPMPGDAFGALLARGLNSDRLPSAA